MGDVDQPMLACLGDLVEDVVVRLDGPVNVASDTHAHISRRRGGSAANVVAIAAALGHPARFLGQVGTDAIGTALLAELGDDGVDTSMVRRGGATGTIVALVDHLGERTMLPDRRACLDLDDPDPSWLDGVDTLHIPFYSLAGGPIAATATTVIGWAHERGVAVSIDVSSTAVILEVGVDEVMRRLADAAPSVVFANGDEAVALTIQGPTVGALTVVKRGARPAVIHRTDGTVVDVDAIAVPGVNDTTGAGDAFAAGFLTSPGWVDDPTSACKSGHRAAAALLRGRC
ncbi:MAG TPA: carbohydrate kinase family protein [Ilumatobacteraceae bacterium]|nr:carbohydrate kinase family protein [Ilumatobacteraceae bacterium]